MKASPLSFFGPPVRTACATLGLMGLPAAVFAGDIYWDSDGATAGGSAGTTATGNWGTSAFWSTDATGSFATTATWNAADTAVFSAGSDVTGGSTITLNADTAAFGLKFEEGAVSLVSATLAKTLSLGAGGIIVYNGSPASGIPTLGGTTAATSLVLSLTADQVWTNNIGSNVLVRSGATSSSNADLTLQGNFDFRSSGSVVPAITLGTGTLTQTSGNVEYGSGTGTNGGFFLKSGQAFIRSAGAVGAGTITLGDTTGSAAVFLRATSVTMANALVLSSNGAITINNLGAGASPTFTGGITGSNNITLQSVIGTGNGGVTFNSAASSSINHTGELTLQNTGQAGANGVAGTVTVNTGIGSNVTNVIVRNDTTEAAGFTKGAQTVVFGGTAKSYTGSTTVNAGAVLELAASNLIPDASNISLNGTLNLRTFSETFGALSGNGTVTKTTGTSTLTLGSGGGSGTFGGSLGNGTGTLNLTKVGTGTQSLTSASSYSGTTTLGNDGGVLAISHGSALGTSAVSLSKAGTATGTLEVSNGITVSNNFTFGSATGFGGGGSAHIRNVSGDNTLAGNLTLTATGGNGINLESAAGKLTLGGTITSTIGDSTRQIGLHGAGDGEVTGSIQNTGANALSVIKSGSGTWTLSGGASYTGSTNVNGGTLQVNTTLSGTSGVTIATGATLQGTGSINTGTVAFSGEGILSAGNSIGIFGLNAADLTNGTLLVEFGTASIDLLNVAGLLDITGATVNFSQYAGALDGVNPYVFATYGSLTGESFLNSFNVPEGYAIDYGTGSNSSLSLVAVPEPGSAAFGSVVVLALFHRRRSGAASS